MTDDLVKRLHWHRDFIGTNPWPDGYPFLQEVRDRLGNAADRIETLTQEVKDLKKLAYAAYCEGFSDGKDGGWIVGPSNQPWKASDAHRMLKTMEAKP